VKRPLRVITASALLVVCSAIALSGCSGSAGSSASSSANTTSAGAKASGPVIIDLRSAEEFKKGHLEGAVNYDFSSGDFSSQISSLDHSSQYQLYGSADQPKMASAVMRNAGFSGGEKTRFEILQMELLRPRFAVLDETDSGLDVDALRIVSEGVNRLHDESDAGFLLITHYTRILRYIKPQFVHVFVDGKMVDQGGPELADRLEEEGYVSYVGKK